VAAARIRARRAGGDRESDADEVVAAAMAADADPWPEAVVIDTGGPVPGAVAAAAASIRS
jgi:plasmid stability protein